MKTFWFFGFNKFQIIELNKTKVKNDCDF